MSSSNMVAVLWGSDLGKGIIDGAAVPCCSWCFEGILKPFHHDFRSRLLGGETAEWIGAATGVLGVFGTFARCCCCCCDAGWDGGVGAADVMVATARRWAAERAPRVAVCCVSASPGSRVQDRIGSCMDGCESEMERQQGRGTWGSPERYARDYALGAGGGGGRGLSFCDAMQCTRPGPVSRLQARAAVDRAVEC
jgi:hypothetical protein